MALSCTFDFNGNAVIVDLTKLKLVPIVLTMYDPNIYNYKLYIFFNDTVTNIDYVMEMRIYTPTLAAMSYKPSNSVGLIESLDIANSDSLSVWLTDYAGRIFNAEAAFEFKITTLNAGVDASGGFSGSLINASTGATVNSSDPLLGPSSSTTTHAITNGAFTEIPIIT